MTEITRPNWNYDNSGAPVAPEAPSPNTVIAMVEKGEAPTPEIQAALGVEPTAAPVPATVQRDAKGNLIKPDWSYAKDGNTIIRQDAVPARSFSGKPDWNYDNDGNEKPRDESGRYLSRSEAEMRAVWDREGGVDQVAQIVTRKEATMYSVAPTLEAKVTEHFDKALLTKAADHLRLGVSYGPTGFWDSVARFEDSLSPSERDAWAKFCRSLDEDEQAALLWGISK
jgi:hypothetical protein